MTHTTELPGWYVYYRPRAGHTRHLLQSLGNMHQDIEQQLGLQVRLLRRQDASPQAATWMEIYQADLQALSRAGSLANLQAALIQAFAQAGLDQWIDGERHIECFLEMNPCV